jgi:hypothetical protein
MSGLLPTFYMALGVGSVVFGFRVFIHGLVNYIDNNIHRFSDLPRMDDVREEMGKPHEIHKEDEKSTE